MLFGEQLALFFCDSENDAESEPESETATETETETESEIESEMNKLSLQRVLPADDPMTVEMLVDDSGILCSRFRAELEKRSRFASTRFHGLIEQMASDSET